MSLAIIAGMRFSGTIEGLVLILSLVAEPGCSKRNAPVVAVATDPSEPRQAQPKLPTMKLWLGPKEIVVEQAVSDEQIAAGLMFREQLGADEGMLFIFPEPQRPAFWMRKTVIPLSCAYIDPGGIILELHDLKPLDETPVAAQPTSRVQYVLEMNQGWFQRNAVGVGATVRTESGALSETYFGQPAE